MLFTCTSLLEPGLQLYNHPSALSAALRVSYLLVVQVTQASCVERLDAVRSAKSVLGGVQDVQEP